MTHIAARKFFDSNFSRNHKTLRIINISRIILLYYVTNHNQIGKKKKKKKNMF